MEHDGYEGNRPISGLEILNTEIRKAGLGEGFGNERVLKELNEIVDLGDEYASPVITTHWGKRWDGTPIEGTYAPIAMKERAREEKGAIQIVLVKNGEELPDSQGPQELTISRENWIAVNKELWEWGRRKLPESMVRDGGWETSTVRQDELFDPVRRLFMGIKFQNKESGLSVPMVFNKSAPDGSQGSGFLIGLGYDKYGFVFDQSPLVDRMGISMSRNFPLETDRFLAMEEETGLKAGNGRIFREFSLREDHAYLNNVVKYTEINFGSVHLTEANEALVEGGVDDETVLHWIEEKQIIDPSTIASWIVSRLGNWKLEVSADSYPVWTNNVVFESDGERLNLPRGNVSLGERKGSIHSNPGLSPIEYVVNKGGVDILRKGPKYVSRNILDVIEMIRLCKLDMVDVSAIGEYLLKEKILVFNREK